MTIEELRAWHAKAVAVLRHVEWAGVLHTDDGPIERCPVCERLSDRGPRSETHAPDCAIAALLEDH